VVTALVGAPLVLALLRRSKPAGAAL
jgi:ABC-type Fe3+-siderophore transport system permease subunit